MDEEGMEQGFICREFLMAVLLLQWYLRSELRA